MFCFFVFFCGWGGWWLWGEWGQTLLHGSLFRSHFLHGNWDLAVIRIIFATRSVYIIMIHCTCRYYIHLSCFDLLIYRSDDQIVLFPLNCFFSWPSKDLSRSYEMKSTVALASTWRNWEKRILLLGEWGWAPQRWGKPWTSISRSFMQNCQQPQVRSYGIKVIMTLTLRLMRGRTW